MDKCHEACLAKIEGEIGKDLIAVAQTFNK